jgi:NADH dehydrogenase
MRVTEIDDHGVWIGSTRIEAATVFWAAGVQGSPLGATLGTPLDRNGRVQVGSDLALPGHPNVFVVGDLASVTDAKGQQVPGVAQGAIQMGRYVAKIIDAEVGAHLRGKTTPTRTPFIYHDKGSMAVIGRNCAIAHIGRWKLSGCVAWFLWAVVHVLFLVSFKSRLMVTFQWFWSYLFLDRGARLITGTGDVKLTRPWVPEQMLDREAVVADS